MYMREQQLKGLGLNIIFNILWRLGWFSPSHAKMKCCLVPTARAHIAEVPVIANVSLSTNTRLIVV